MTKQLNTATYSLCGLCTVVTKEGFRATTLSIFMSQAVQYLEHLQKKKHTGVFTITFWQFSDFVA